MANMTDIAKECGVSRAVVSLVLNGRDKELGIAEKTRDLIWDVTRRLGYCRNEMAASIAKKHGNVVAFVNMNMGNAEYTGRIQSGLFAEASSRNYSVAVYHLDENNGEDILRKILGWRSAGVIFHVAGRDIVSSITSALEMNKIPYGFANLSNPGGIGVTTDDYNGMKCAVKHLVEQGRRRILLLSGTNNSETHEYLTTRCKGYKDGLAEYLPKQSPTTLCIQSSTPFSCVELIRDELQSYRPDSVICVSDDLAMRTFSAALQMGLQIPEDLAIIGYGNLSMSEYASVPLSTVGQNFEDIGQMTARFVLDAVEGNNVEQTTWNRQLPVELMIRESSGNNSQKGGMK